MKTFKQFLSDGILDDIVKDFPNQPKKKNIRVIKDVPRRRHAARKFSGQKVDEFSYWIRSESELKKQIKEKLGNSKITLKGVIDLLAYHNMKVDERIRPQIAIKDLYTIREWDRKLINGFTGKNTTEDMEKKRKKYAKNGIKNAGVVDLRRLRNGSVTAILGEGNHRVKLGLEIGIKTMPIIFMYG